MSMYAAVASSIFAFGITASAYGVQAAPASPSHTVAHAEQATVQQIANQRQRARRLTTTATGSGPCGVWRCTWPTSDGGCLVWEKTKCKTIDPFN